MVVLEARARVRRGAAAAAARDVAAAANAEYDSADTATREAAGEGMMMAIAI